MSGAPAQKCWAVVPAAGTGSRMQAELPKQYLEIAGATVLEHSLSALLHCDFIEKIILALSPDDQRGPLLAVCDNPRIVRVEGGEHRSDSVLAALRVLTGMAAEDDWVLVHDAARPCVATQDISRLAQRALQTGTGCILAQPLVDTVKRSTDDGLVESTLAREHLWAAQTPQMFRLGLLREALQSAIKNGQQVTDEASAMELAGEAVQLLEGSVGNLKITVPGDVCLAEFYLAANNDNSNLSKF